MKHGPDVPARVQVRLGMSADERAKIADQLLAFSDGKRLG
jgi:hypothetical protein